MDFGVATLSRGACGGSRGIHRRGRGRRAARLRLHQRQRPRRRAARYRLALSLQRDRRVGGAHGRRVPRPALHARLPCRPHRAPAAADLGHGGAATPSRADRQDAGHHRRALQRPADRRLRRRLAEGGVRGARRPALRRARARHRRISSTPSRRSGPRTRRASAARTSASTISCLRPSRSPSRIRRSGSAARARWRSSARCAWATAGIRPPTTRSIGSTRRRGSARPSASCSASPRPRGAIPPHRRRLSRALAGRLDRADDGRRRAPPAHRQLRGMAADIAALRKRRRAPPGLTFQTAKPARDAGAHAEIRRGGHAAGEMMGTAGFSQRHTRATGGCSIDCTSRSSNPMSLSRCPATF